MKFYRVLMVISILFILNGCDQSNNDLIETIEQLESKQMKLERDIAFQTEQLAKVEELKSDVSDIRTEIERLSKNVNDYTNVDSYTDKLDSLEESFGNLESRVEFLSYMSFESALFDRNEAKINDYYAGMRLAEIDSEENMGNLYFLFEGEKQLTGKFEIYQDHEWFGSIVTFTIEEKVTDVLPREIGDRRRLWFEFSNFDEAFELLRPYGNTGTVTILIDEYYIDLLPSESINQARLVKIVNKYS